jgi:hypothetical protein
VCEEELQRQTETKRHIESEKRGILKEEERSIERFREKEKRKKKNRKRKRD